MTNELGKYFVLDLTQGKSGAVCTEYLALAGMDVIRVEKPDFAPDREEKAEYIVHNLNKRYITADEKTPEGLALVRTLAAKADVIVENRAKEEMEALSLDYESVKAANPGAVYVSILPYADDSPWAGYPADRSVLSAMGGATYLCGDFGGEPLEPGGDIPDVTSCTYAATAIAAALFKREETGNGKHIEVNQLDSVVALSRSAYEKFYRLKSNTRAGNLLMNCAPTDLFKTKDGGYAAIMCLSEPEFKPLCTAMGMPELAEDPRFLTQKDRVKNRAEIDSIVAAWAINYTKLEIMQKLLAENRVICSAVNGMEDIVNAEDFRAMGFIQRVDDPEIGEIWVPVYPAVSDEFKPVAAAPAAISADELRKEKRYGL